MSESPAPKPAAPTFESGARAMNEALQTKGVEAYFADASDPLHKAFIAKAAVHSGPGGRPLIGEEAEKAIDSHYDTPRSGRSLAYIHPENRGIYTQSDSPKKSSRNIWSLAVVSVDQRY